MMAADERWALLLLIEWAIFKGNVDSQDIGLGLTALFPINTVYSILTATTGSFRAS